MGHEVMNYADGHLDAPGVGGFNAKEGFSQNSVEAQRSLDLAVERSNDLGVQLFAVSGDLFHSGNPSPEIVARAVERLRRLNAKWIVADGNHDQSGVPAGHRNALAAYLAEQPGCVGVYSEPAVHEFNGLYVAVLP